MVSKNIATKKKNTNWVNNYYLKLNFKKIYNKIEIIVQWHIYLFLTNKMYCITNDLI